MCVSKKILFVSLNIMLVVITVVVAIISFPSNNSDNQNSKDHSNKEVINKNKEVINQSNKTTFKLKHLDLVNNSQPNITNATNQFNFTHSLKTQLNNLIRKFISIISIILKNINSLSNIQECSSIMSIMTFIFSCLGINASWGKDISSAKTIFFIIAFFISGTLTTISLVPEYGKSITFFITITPTNEYDKSKEFICLEFWINVILWILWLIFDK